MPTTFESLMKALSSGFNFIVDGENQLWGWDPENDLFYFQDGRWNPVAGSDIDTSEIFLSGALVTTEAAARKVTEEFFTAAN
ncbi:MAG: hypothetical protein R2688_09830 [Fimbriimonadaceae bacterium]